MKFKEHLAPVPMLLTLGNLLCGFGAIAWCSMGSQSRNILDLEHANLKYAAYLILLAMVFDVLDGWAARATNSTTVFGAELDSLSDLVSFGVAPALLARQVIIIYSGTTIISHFWVWACAAAYVSCTALRLARFNIESDADAEKHADFKGLPSPAAAAAVIALVILHLYMGYPPDWFQFDIIKTFYQTIYESNIVVLLLPFTLVVGGLLMLTEFRYVHIANKLLTESKDITIIPFLILLVLFALAFFPIIFPIAMLLYVASGIINLGLDKLLDYINQKTQIQNGNSKK